MGEPTSRAGSRLLYRPPAGHGTTAKAASTAHGSAEQQGKQANTGQGERGDRQETGSASAENNAGEQRRNKKQKTVTDWPHPETPSLPLPLPPHIPPVQVRAEPLANDKSEPRDHKQRSLSPGKRCRTAQPSPHGGGQASEVRGATGSVHGRDP